MKVRERARCCCSHLLCRGSRSPGAQLHVSSLCVVCIFVLMQKWFQVLPALSALATRRLELCCRNPPARARERERGSSGLLAASRFSNVAVDLHRRKAFSLWIRLILRRANCHRSLLVRGNGGSARAQVHPAAQQWKMQRLV